MNAVPSYRPVNMPAKYETFPMPVPPGHGASAGRGRIVGSAEPRAHHSRRAADGGHAEPVIGRAFARPGGFAHPTDYVAVIARRQRINPPRRTRMDCFVALLLAMTTLHCRCDKATRRANQQNLSIPSRKNISLNPSGKSKVKSRPSRPARGAYRDRHGRRVRDAVAAAMPGAQDVCRADVSVSEHSAPDESIVADGKTVWSWRPLLASSRRWSSKTLPGFALAFNPAATEARGIRLRGERDISL